MKLTGAAILVSRGMKVLQAAPAAYPYRSTGEGFGVGEAWEAVHTMDDWYDGPRGGVADFRGSPHYYRSVYLDTPKWNPDEDRFELTPLPRDAFEAALELQAIWERWHSAYKAGTAPEDPDDERVLPADRQRRDELEQVLAAGRAANASRTVLVHGEFELGCKRVRWWPVAEARQAEPGAAADRRRYDG